MIKFLLALYASYLAFSVFYCFMCGYGLNATVTLFVAQFLPFVLGVYVGRGEK